MVELSGNRPPSPRSRAAAFSRLSLEFVLGEIARRGRARFPPQILSSRAAAGSCGAHQPEFVTELRGRSGRRSAVRG